MRAAPKLNPKCAQQGAEAVLGRSVARLGGAGAGGISGGNEASHTLKTNIAPNRRVLDYSPTIILDYTHKAPVY